MYLTISAIIFSFGVGVTLFITKVNLMNTSIVKLKDENKVLLNQNIEHRVKINELTKDLNRIMKKIDPNSQMNSTLAIVTPKYKKDYDDTYSPYSPLNHTINDLSDLNIEGVEVLSYKRHNKKLRIGGLEGNRFEIILRDVTDVDELVRRWHVVSNFGVPNYFGEQRFGINGGNIEKALSLFSGGKVKDKKKRGMYLSAARSLIFNQIISERIKQQNFDTLLNGDVLMLSGTQSVFLANDIDESLKARHLSHDLDITAPMWGAGELMTTADALALEQDIAKHQQVFCEGLPRFGLKQERRRIRLVVKEPKIELKNDIVTLSFFLPAGAYATTIMRELLNYTDMTERVDTAARNKG